MKKITVKDINIKRENDKYIFTKNISTKIDSWGNDGTIQIHFILSKVELEYILNKL